MEDLSGIGKSMNIKSGSTSFGCMTGTSKVQKAGWFCNNVNCPWYNSWKCIWGL
jgi:hypothetical protein